MHLALKNETIHPTRMNSLQKQNKFDDFLEQFNSERTHQALDIKCPAELYTPSTRPYRGLTELDYPFHDKTTHVTLLRTYLSSLQKKINVSTVFAGQGVGIKESRLVSSMDYDVGYIDLEERTL